MNSRVIGILIAVPIVILTIVISRNLWSPQPASSMLVAKPAETHITASAAASTVQNLTVMILNTSKQSVTLEEVRL